MIIKFPHRIYPSFIKEHPDWIFIYSTDSLNKGGMGMAWHIAGQPNSFPVPTVVKFCANKVFFDDYLLQNNIDIIDNFIKQIPRDGRPIIVPPKIGMGCSRMRELAPKTYQYLILMLATLKGNLYDYKTTYS